MEVKVLQDIVVRSITEDGLIRGAAAITTELVETARIRHNTVPTATAALGRTLIANIFLALNFKGDDTVTMRIKGDGPLGGIITQADANCNVKGYVQNPNCHLPSTLQGKLDVGTAVGKEGFLYVTSDLGLKDRYTGSSPLISGEIGDDVAYYLQQSQQTPAAVAVGVLVDRDWRCIAAGGFFIQAMPGVTNEILSILENNLKNISSVTQLIHDGYTPEKMLSQVFQNMPFKVIDENIPRFSCDCNKKRLEEILISLGKDELQDMIAKDKGVELHCHFCSEYYYFSSEELAVLVKEIEENKKKPL